MELGTTWPSALTSVVLLLIVRSSTYYADVPLLKIVFMSMLPSFMSILFLQERLFFRIFLCMFQILSRVDELEDVQEYTCSAVRTKEQMSVDSALAELLKAIGDPSTSRMGATGSSTDGYSPHKSDTNIISSNTNTNGLKNSGKALYNDVKEHLIDHLFLHRLDAPIYFMNPNDGTFLHVNDQEKLVLTTSPDASCLFHVVKGKTHHWGFYSTLYHRYLGQNMLGKMVVHSKSMNSWEAFRVLSQPEGEEDEGPPKIYFVLCSARFGKGMWLARRNSTGDIYLSKNFSNALPLVYASDLAALELMGPSRSTVPVFSPIHHSNNIEYTQWSGLMSPSRSLGIALEPPLLTITQRERVLLPWIEDSTCTTFFELQEQDMSELLTTIIPRCSVRAFVDMFIIDEKTRRRCYEKMSMAEAPTGSSASAVGNTHVASARSGPAALSEWHIHPHFGFVRKLSYRPNSSEHSETRFDQVQDEGTLPSSSRVTMSIDQYHSCSVDEKTMNKAIFRSKLYTLSIPYSNCFSIETVFEVSDIIDRETSLNGSNKSVSMSFKCRAGVYFSRKTMFAPQIEKGVLDGISKTCELLVSRVKDLISNSQQSASNDLSTPPTNRQKKIAPRDAFPPHTLTLQVIRGIVTVVCDKDLSHTSTSYLHLGLRSSLVLHMPWVRKDTISNPIAIDFVAPHHVQGFFESSTWTCIVDESLGTITPQLFFDALLSDECSFFHGSHSQSGNMEVDIGAWRTSALIARSRSNPPPPNSNSETKFTLSVERLPSVFIRKQVFQMPMCNVPGVEIATVEDYQYYVLDPGVNKCLEFGMKLFVRELPEGDLFSIEILVIVSVDDVNGLEGSDHIPMSSMKVYYNIATKYSINPCIARGTARGLKNVWKPIARTMFEASQMSHSLTMRLFGHHHPKQTLEHHNQEDIRQRLQMVETFPTHDEMSSKIIEAIADVY